MTIEDEETQALALRPGRSGQATVSGVVGSPAPVQATAFAAVQTEHLIGNAGDALRLLDAVERVRGHAHPLVLGLQDAVGLKMPAALVLSAIANGRSTAEGVAEQIGTTTAEAELAISDLAALGMVKVGRQVVVTGLGQARLSQLDGLTVRVLDVVTGILGPDDAAHLVRLLHTVADGLEGASTASGPSQALPQVFLQN